MVNEIWKRECHPTLFRVQHHKPQQFLLCQWQTRQEVHLAYFLYRWFMAAVFLTTMICSICDVGRIAEFNDIYIKWPIYLTNWGYAMCTLQAILGASLLSQQFLQKRKNGKYLPVTMRLPLMFQMYWISHTIALVLAFGITICYWATVYSPGDHKLDALNVLVHAGNSVLMLIDFSLVAHPFRLLHCYWPFSFTGCYLLFNLIYFELGGTDRRHRTFIYPLLDWKRPRRALLASVFGLVFILLVHCGLWVLFLLRRWVAVRLKRRNDQDTSGVIYQTNSASVQIDFVDC